SDTGIGIPSEMLRGVFDLFVQVDHSLERAQGGLGIGLTLVRRLVEMHGGTVDAFSAGSGRGSQFTVRLPLAPAPLPNDTPVQKRTRAPRAAGRRVLVVDDNVDSADSLAALLTAIGHDVMTAGDGAEAVERVRDFRPEVVLMDIGLPRVDGYEAARRI